VLAVYIGCLVFGGILLAASAVGGHQGDSGGHDTGNGHGHDHGAGDGGHALPVALLPFLGLRFWTFALAFFGLTGALLTATGAAPVVITALLAGGTGVSTGYAAARLVGALMQRPVGLLAATPVGREGKLLLPVDKSQPGKIRVSVGGVDTDLVAYTDSESRMSAGTRALIVGMRNNAAVVEQSPTGNSDDDGSGAGSSGSGTPEERA
jgi:hypothetical protein